MANTNIGFYHLSEALDTIVSPETGVVYFSDTDHTIGVGTDAGMQKYYGGNVKNATYVNSKLTITYFDGADAVLDFSDVASADGVKSIISDLRKDIETLQGSSHTHSNMAVLMGLTSKKTEAWDTAVSDINNHMIDADSHVTLEDKSKWNDKQAALSADQLAAANSGITATKVSGYDNHVGNADIHVTAEQKTAWTGKQDALSGAQLAAANSGITSDKVNGYDTHVSNDDIHVTTADKDKWNAAEKNAKAYADGLASNYDAAGAAATAEQNAKAYADGLAKNYDAAGAAAQALVDAKAYTDGKITDLNLGSASQKNVLTGAIADSTTNEDDLVTAAQVKAYASGVVGAMHFRGAVENTSDIADPASGDICLVGTKEYVYNGAAWVLFGDEGAYDTKGSAATAEQNAKTYANGLNEAMNTRVSDLEAIDHDAYKAADEATLASAKSYADGLASNYATASHTHAISDVTDLQTTLDGKAASVHTHAIADVTGLQDALAGKADKVHTHAIADVIGLQNALDEKAASDHNHDTVYSKLDHNHDDAYDAKGAAATVKSAVIGNANTDTKESNTIVGAKKYTDDAIAAATLVWKQF